jgi:hypothetical protein
VGPKRFTAEERDRLLTGARIALGVLSQRQVCDKCQHTVDVAVVALEGASLADLADLDRMAR